MYTCDDNFNKVEEYTGTDFISDMEQLRNYNEFCK